MTQKIVSAMAVLLGAGGLLGACGFEQPTAGCITQDSSAWLVAYTLDPASISGGASCGADSRAAGLKGELMGVFKFSDPDNREDTRLVLRPDGLASLAERDPRDPQLQNASGRFAQLEPDASTLLCSVPEFSEASVDAGPVSANPATGTPASSAVQRSYRFSNVQVYAAPSAPGTSLKGELVYSEEGCTARYSFHALWPPVECDPAADPTQSPAEACGKGSGVNEDFKVRCDAALGEVLGTTGMCVLADDGQGSFPPLK